MASSNDSSSATSTLNLALLGLAHDPSLDTARHPQYEDLTTIENIRWLCLDFKNADGTHDILHPTHSVRILTTYADFAEFHKAFETANEERNRRDEAFDSRSKTIRKHSARPRNGSIRSYSEAGSVLSFRTGSVASFRSGSERPISQVDPLVRTNTRS